MKNDSVQKVCLIFRLFISIQFKKHHLGFIYLLHELEDKLAIKVFQLREIVRSWDIYVVQYSPALFRKFQKLGFQRTITSFRILPEAETVRKILQLVKCFQFVHFLMQPSSQFSIPTLVADCILSMVLLGNDCLLKYLNMNMDPFNNYLI